MASSGFSLPLWEAVGDDDFETVTRLLDEGADINMSDEKGCSLLFHATATSIDNNTHMIRLLLERGADVEEKDGAMSALQLACFFGDVAAANVLLVHEADLGVQSEFQIPSILVAIRCRDSVKDADQVRMIRLLVSFGADLQYNQRGKTLLMYAAKQGRIAVIRELISLGLDPEACSEKGKTAMTYAHDAGHTEIEDMLRMEIQYRDSCVAFATGNQPKAGHRSLVRELHTELINMILAHLSK
jgi:ankyrin repeat protein